MAKPKIKEEIKEETVFETKKIKAIVDCTGNGYENFKKSEERVLPTNIADLLILFGYAEEIK